MLTISKSALEAAKNVGGSFVVTIMRSPVCCSGGTLRKVAIDLHEEFSDSTNIYTVSEYEGVKIYISKGIKLKENANIYKKLNIPGIGPVFGSKGILPVDDVNAVI